MRIGSLHLCGGRTTEDICTSSYKETRHRFVFFSIHPEEFSSPPHARVKSYSTVLDIRRERFLSLFNR